MYAIIASFKPFPLAFPGARITERLWYASRMKGTDEWHRGERLRVVWDLKTSAGSPGRVLKGSATKKIGFRVAIKLEDCSTACDFNKRQKDVSCTVFIATTTPSDGIK